MVRRAGEPAEAIRGRRDRGGRDAASPRSSLALSALLGLCRPTQRPPARSRWRSGGGRSDRRNRRPPRPRRPAARARRSGGGRRGAKRGRLRRAGRDVGRSGRRAWRRRRGCRGAGEVRGARRGGQGAGRVRRWGSCRVGLHRRRSDAVRHRFVGAPERRSCARGKKRDERPRAKPLEVEVLPTQVGNEAPPPAQPTTAGEGGPEVATEAAPNSPEARAPAEPTVAPTAPPEQQEFSVEAAAVAPPAQAPATPAPAPSSGGGGLEQSEASAANTEFGP